MTNISDTKENYQSHIRGFDGEGLVELFDGNFKQVKNIKRGDLVKVNDTLSVIVRCVVRNHVVNPYLININGVFLTPSQPFKENENHHKWLIPITHNNAVSYSNIKVIYNFVLNIGHLIHVNNMICRTLGYLSCNISDNLDNTNHIYFDTNKVIEDLMKIRGWDNGDVWMNTQDYNMSNKSEVN
jgi:hypothetical protein